MNLNKIIYKFEYKKNVSFFQDPLFYIPFFDLLYNK